MAELAVAASVVQLIHVGGSIVTLLSGIIADIRVAPDRIRTLLGEVQTLLNLVRHIQSNAAVAVVFNATIDREILSDTIAKAQRLHHLLDGLHVELNKGFDKRTWAAIRTVHKVRELDNLCEGLERQKSNLLIWFAEHKL